MLVTLAVGALLGLAPVLTGPAVVPSSAPASVFSSERAMHDLRVIAATPRPIGSPGNTAARAYIVEQLMAIGLQPEVQTAVGVGHFRGSSTLPAGLVNNIVARLPGTASSGAIVLDAHYDGAASGPGAADCGSCVVTVLETMRALRAGPPLHNNVIAVFTDGEEVGDVGAAAFMQSHPWASDVCLALNFEGWARGGQTMLYTASVNDAALLSEFLPPRRLRSARRSFAHWQPWSRLRVWIWKSTPGADEMALASSS